MFYVQDDIVIDMADFFPLNKHKAKYNEVKQNNSQKYSD